MLYERPYTSPQQALQQSGEPRRIWALGHLGGFCHIMRCGPLAGHSQQGTADLSINTVSAQKPSIKRVHQGAQIHQSLSLRWTQKEITKDITRNYSSLPDFWQVRQTACSVGLVYIKKIFIAFTITHLTIYFS